MTPERKRRVRRILILFVLFTLIFLALILLQKRPLPEEPVLPPAAVSGQGGKVTSAPETDTGAVIRPDFKTALVPPREMTRTPAPGKDTTVVAQDTLSSFAQPADTTPPYVSADPGPGLHPAPIRVTLKADESADIQYALDPDTTWQPYSSPIPVSDSAIITFRGRDKSGNVSAPVQRAYIIRVPIIAAACPPDMVPVEAKPVPFCIDRYEWPNRKGAEPTGYLNWYMAYDSCRTYKKRLCSAEEWEAACAGPSDKTYPYGDDYDSRACNTENVKPLPSGSRVECRSYAGAYDLSGNLREWTSTQSVKNEKHYQVYGGYWENRGASRCRSTQYSFFPENKFISIGFRCCKDAGNK